MNFFRGENLKAPGQVEAEEAAEKIAQRFSEQGLQVVEELLDEVQSMTPSSRYNRQKTKEEIADTAIYSGASFSPAATQAIGKEGEAGFKRVQLESDLRAIQSQLLSTTEALKRTYMDLKATETE